MVVGTIRLSLRLEGCFSLKDKRRILRSLLDRTRRQFGVSVAETDDNDLWNVATVGIACIANEVAQVESVLDRTLQEFDGCPDLCVEGVERQIERR